MQAVGLCPLPTVGAPPDCRKVLVLVFQCKQHLFPCLQAESQGEPSPLCSGCWSGDPDWSRRNQEINDPGILFLQYDEDGMVEAVGKHNPVSFAFEVTANFMHYKKGVYSK